MGDFGVCPDSWLQLTEFREILASVFCAHKVRQTGLWIIRHKILNQRLSEFPDGVLAVSRRAAFIGKAHITYVGPLSWIKKYLNHKDVQTSKVVIAFISAYRFLTFVKFQTKIISFWGMIKFPWPKFLFNTWLCKSGFFCRTKQFHLNQIPDISSLFRYRRHRGLAFRGETLVMSSEHSINTSFLHNFFVLATYLRQGNLPDIT